MTRYKVTYETDTIEGVPYGAEVETLSLLPYRSDLAPTPDILVDHSEHENELFTTFLAVKFGYRYLTAEETRQVIEALQETLGEDA